MKLFDPDPSLSWLFCLTHPDDEISIAAWIRHLTSIGATVYLSWTHSIPVREAEARAGANRVGVLPANLYFWGATDGSVCDELAQLRPKFEQMMREVRPDRVACGAFEQGHLDHDSTHWLVTHSFDGPVLEIPFYHPYCVRLQTLNRFSDPTNEEIRHHSMEERRFKKTFARGFPSQNILSILVGYEVWHWTRLRRARLAHAERMRLWPNQPYTEPAHPEHIADRVRSDPQWRRWLRAEERARLAPGEADHADPSGQLHP